MKAILLSLSLLILPVTLGQAVDIVTPGATFKNIKVTKVEADAVRITHSEGTALVDFDDLPPAMQAEYGWTAEKSATRKAAREAEAKRLADEERMIDEAPKRRAMEAAAIRKAEEEKQAEIDRARRKIENAKFDAESANAQKDLIEAAAKARAALDAERAKTKAKPDEIPVATIIPEAGTEVKGTPAPKNNVVMPPFGAVSDALVPESSIFENKMLWLCVGVGILVLVCLFTMSSSTTEVVRVSSADGVRYQLPKSSLRILPALLLCLLFGGLGVHRFYVGKVASGGFFLVAFVLCFFGIPWLLIVSGIWFLFDLIFIIAGTFTDSKGRTIDKWT